MHEVLVNCLGGLSLPRKSVDRLIDRPDMTLDVCHGCKTTIQQQQLQKEQVVNFFVKKKQNTHTHIFDQKSNFLEFLKNFILILKCRFTDEEILLWKTDS